MTAPTNAEAPDGADREATIHYAQPVVPPGSPIGRIDENGVTVIEWPNGRGRSFEIASDLFEELIDELNVLRSAPARVEQPVRREIPDIDVDIFNAQMVGSGGGTDICVIGPRQVMTNDEALVHAAWLVAIANRPLGADHPGVTRFDAILRKVENT